MPTREATTKRHIDDRMRAVRTVFCAEQEFLRHLGDVAGVIRVTIWAIGPKHYELSVRLKSHPNEWFLATWREKQKPRSFFDVAAAIHFAHRMFKSPALTVEFRNPHRT